jgi:hypothetical protein
MKVLKNLSIFFFIAMGLGISAVFVLLLMVLVFIFPKFLPFLDNIKKLIFFNPILRFGLQSYLKFCEIAFLFFENQIFKEYPQTKNTQSSLTTSIIALIYIILAPILTWIFLKKN